MRVAVAVTLLAATSLAAGCSSAHTDLPYKPDAAPPGVAISAAYTVAGDRLRIEIDTGGRRLERAQIVKADDTLLEAQTIEYTAPSGGMGSPIGIGIGIGTFGGRGGVSTGAGVSTGGVVGGGGSSVGTSTIASFPLDQAGPRPWRLRVKLQGLEPIDVVVGEPEGSPKPAPR